MALTERYVTTTGAGAHDGTSEANAFSWAEMITDSATSADGTRYNVKNNATYSRTTSVDAFGSGSATGPLIIRGYATIIGDGYQGRTSGNGALITSNMPLITYTSGRLGPGGFVILEALQFEGTDTTNGGPLQLGASARNVARGVKSTNTGTGVNACAFLAVNNVTLIDCDGIATGGSGASAVRCTATSRFFGNRLTSSSGSGITVANSVSNIVAALNTCYTNGASGIVIGTGASGSVVIFNTLVGATASGVVIGGSSTGTHIVFGNMMTDNGANAGNFSAAANEVIVAYNRTRDNTSGAYSLATDWVAATSWGEVTTDTGGPSTDYVNSGANDYSLVATSPGVSAAIPLYASMGALQRSQMASLAPSPLISTLVQSVGNGT